MHRLISDYDKETVDNLKVFYGFTVTSLALSAPLLAVGDLLHTWIFVHSLQLIAHTPLLNSEMPGNAQYFLQDYLSAVRLRDPVYDQPAPLVAATLSDQAIRMLQSFSLVGGSSAEQ